MAGKKPTKQQVEERVSFVYRGLVSGMPRHELIKACDDKFAMIPRTVDSYIVKAWGLLEGDSERDRKKNRQISLARYSRIFNQLFIKKKYTEAMKAQERIDKLQFLDILQQEKEDDRAKMPSEIAPEEREARKRQLREMIGKGNA